METFYCLVFLLSVSSLTWSEKRISHERFLNISFIPPSPTFIPPHLLEAVGACHGGRCPGVTGGAISSPSFPLNYPDKSSVEYHLETYRDSHIQIQFEVFDLEETPNCRADYVVLSRVVEFTKKYKPTRAIHKIICGKDLPGPLTSWNNKLHIRFESDYMKNGQGFLATWKEVPPMGLIKGQTQGEFNTPNYPEKYPKHHRMKQIFAIPDGAKVEFKVVDFQLGEHHQDHFCINSPDWKISRPDPDENQCYSGKISSIPTYEKDPKLRYFTLAFRSGRIRHRGINIQWKFV